MFLIKLKIQCKKNEFNRTSDEQVTLKTVTEGHARNWPADWSAWQSRKLMKKNETKFAQTLTKFDETWTKGLHQQQEEIPKRFSQKDQVFIIDFEDYEKGRVWTRTHEILKSKVLELMDWLKIEGTWLASS